MATRIVNLEIDSTQLILRLRNGQRRLAYAAVNAINNTAKRIQAAEWARAQEIFTIRKVEFMRREVAKIKPFASVRAARAFAEISVGQKDRLLLSAFERGAVREPVMEDAKRVAEPIDPRKGKPSPARPTWQQNVLPELWRRRLNFDLTKRGKKRKAVRETRTYLIPALGIFQRIGPGPVKIATRAVYLFTKGKKLRPILKFKETGIKEAKKWFREEMQRETVNAIARSKGQGL